MSQVHEGASGQSFETSNNVTSYQYCKLTGMLGVLEHGLFLNMCKRMIVGCSSGEVKVIENPSK